MSEVPIPEVLQHPTITDSGIEPVEPGDFHYRTCLGLSVAIACTSPDLSVRRAAQDIAARAVNEAPTDLAAAARGPGRRDALCTDLPVGERTTYLQDQIRRALTAQWDRLGVTVTDQTILAVATRDALRRRAS